MSASGPRSFDVRLRNRRVQKELAAVPEPDHRRVLQALHELEDNPRPARCARLYGHVYRIRVGRWRIVFLINEAARRIDVGGIRRRNERTYKGIDELFL